MRNQFALILLLLCAVAPADAQVSVAIGLPSVRIGINLPVYPRLVRVPGYPVYYADDADWNYFFYDGMYWVYQDDYWYASSWYNGPWDLVEPDFVPLFVLRVPVRYYRRPPMYFRVWQADRPPHWDEHWGNDWSRRRSGWDQWNHNSAPRPAPLPTYQRQYTGDRYPRADQQPVLREQHYQYQPRDPLVRKHESSPQRQAAPVDTARPEERSERRQERNTMPGASEHNRSSPPSQSETIRHNVPDAPRGPMPQPGGNNRRQSPVTNEVAPQRPQTPREQSPRPEPRREQRSPTAPDARGPDRVPENNETPQRDRRGQKPEQDTDKEKQRNDDDHERGRK